MRQLTIIGTFLFSFALHAQDTWKDVYRESAWAGRDSWQKANELIQQLNLKTNSHVADVGCHEGYMTVKLAALVKTGKVYAVDVEQPKLDKLKTNLSNRKLENVITIKGDYDNPKLPVNTLDAVIIVDTYHEMDEHDKILKHIKTALKPGGRLVLCEAIADARRESTRQEQERKHELSINFALADLKAAGFTIIKQQDPFADRTKEKGDKMWLIVAENP
ncbi:MAG: methyltransferase domain-containing protein [Cyclobacteriaceae bacterium]|nr:MAG: methyltransferase domain-containing protein [Cyclobacteriaceae bacterium]